MRLIWPCYHCVKSVQIWSFFWSLFFRIRTEYRHWLSKSSYSVRIRENTDQRKLCIWVLFTQGTLLIADKSLYSAFADPSRLCVILSIISTFAAQDKPLDKWFMYNKRYSGMKHSGNLLLCFLSIRKSCNMLWHFMKD